MADQLKKWLVDNDFVKEDGTDDEFKAALGAAWVAGKMTADLYAKLTETKEDREAASIDKRFDELAKGLDRVVEAVLKSGEKPKDEDKTSGTKAEDTATKAEPKKQREPSALEKKLAAIGGGIEYDLTDETKTANVRVKAEVEKYDPTPRIKSFPATSMRGTPNPYAGQVAVNMHGRQIDGSQKNQALAGVFLKFRIAADRFRDPREAWRKMTEHEKGLLAHLAEEEDWDVSTDEEVRITKGFRGGVKDLIDDALSGGFEAAPIVFDDAFIQAPLLYGELFPLVNQVTIARGRRIEGVQVGRVTGGWGGVDATPITIFNTAGFVTAFDTTIHRWQGAFRLGLDFMSDTPLEFGRIVSDSYGQEFLRVLDDAIATGTGAGQPTGIMNSGAAAVAWVGATSVVNYENLMGAIAKAELSPGVAASAVFCGTQTTYNRAKGIPVGATDQRRVFAWADTTTGGYADYRLMGHPYKINTSLANTQAFFAILKRYRMYRRQGFQLSTTTEGQTLKLNNEMLIVVTARYGGQLERAACASLTTTAPA